MCILCSLWFFFGHLNLHFIMISHFLTRTLNYYLVYMIYSQLTFLVDWWAPATLNIYLQTGEQFRILLAHYQPCNVVIYMMHIVCFNFEIKHLCKEKWKGLFFKLLFYLLTSNAKTYLVVNVKKGNKSAIPLPPSFLLLHGCFVIIKSCMIVLLKT